MSIATSGAELSWETRWVDFLERSHGNRPGVAGIPRQGGSDRRDDKAGAG